MAYSADGTRLFSCGTTKEGEWNESEGAIKRMYHGLGKRSIGVVQFDTTKSCFLAAGDEFVIKFWDMDNTNLLTTTDAEGGLPASPCIRFSKEGIFWLSQQVRKVSRFLQIVTMFGLCTPLKVVHLIPLEFLLGLLQDPNNGHICASSSDAGTNVGVADGNAPVMVMVAPNGDTLSLPHVKPRITDELEKPKIWKMSEINEPSQLRSLRLPDNLLSVRISLEEKSTFRRVNWRHIPCSIH